MLDLSEIQFTVLEVDGQTAVSAQLCLTEAIVIKPEAAAQSGMSIEELVARAKPELGRALWRTAYADLIPQLRELLAAIRESGDIRSLVLCQNLVATLCPAATPSDV
jgi:hypothetical protein